MLQEDKILVGKGEEGPVYLLLSQANRHGLIAGASGTGKTVTMKALAQGFSQAGVPTFVVDAKGDVSGMCEPGEMNKHIQASVDSLGLQDTWKFEGCPVRFWNMLGGEGIPVRIRISDMGPVLLSRLLGLNETQQGVLNIVFHVADDMGLLLIDMKDLRSMLAYVGQHADEYETSYGFVSTQTIGTIQRALLPVMDQGGDIFFGEPNLDLDDWFAVTYNGQGYVNILDATQLINSPQVYAMFLMWMLSDLYDTLPEVGDPEKPKLVFFFDEAHLLFDDAPKELMDKIIQVVKLIRSKGVGVYFITQSPGDIPNDVLAQLSNRVQHGLRAYTPNEQKVVKAAAQSFRQNAHFDAEEAINELGTGEALVSCLDEKGTPSIVERTKILACQCSMSQATPEGKEQAMRAESGLMGKYENAIDAQSAYEDLETLNAEEAAAAEAEAQAIALAKLEAQIRAAREKKEAQEAAAAAKKAEREAAAAQKAAERQAAAEEKARQKKQDEMNKAVQKLISSVVSNSTSKKTSRSRSSKKTQDAIGDLVGTAGTELMRGILGNLLK